MLPESIARIEALPADARVLDIGGWASPLARADVVVDLMPYETRGLYGTATNERFTNDTWVLHDICGRDPFPFPDDAFDLVVCSHVLEDIRDPVWVAQELSRVGKAGYVEVPSRLEEQSWGVNGPWVGWSHHHWLIDADHERQRLDFVFKLHALHMPAPNAWTFPASFGEQLTPQERVSALWWDGTLTATERTFESIDAQLAWLAEPVTQHAARIPAITPPGRRARLNRRLGRA